MFARRETQQETRRPVRGTTTRTRGTEETASGRRIYELLQRSRQGTPLREGRTEPAPRETVEAPRRSKKSGLRRFAWFAGGITAVGAGVLWMRNRNRRSQMRRYE